MRALGRQKKLWTSVDIKLQTNRVPILTRGNNRIFNLLINETEDFIDSKFGDNINQKYKDGTLVLEDILSTGEKAHVRLFVFCYDSFSGSRKVFASKRYFQKDILNRGFLSIPWDDITKPIPKSEFS